MIEGLQRFYRDHRVAPLSSDQWQELTKGTGGDRRGVGNPYPSFYGVLRHFSSFREAWTAAGVWVNRDWEPWTAEEDSFIAEGAGVFARKELAEALGRTPNAVHRRLYDIGVHTYEARGWTFNRVMRVTGLPDYILRRYANRGELPYFRGSKCLYVDPADLLVIAEIDWNNAPAELAEAVRKSLMTRLVKIMGGQDWRAGRLYRPHRTTTTTKYHKRNPPPAIAKPNHVDVGDRVRVVKIDPNRPEINGRAGYVHTIYWSAYGGMSAARRGNDAGGAWVARVEYKRDPKQNLPRLNRIVPVLMLRKHDDAT